MGENDLISRAEAIDVIRSMTISLGGAEIFHPEAKKSVLSALDDLAAEDAVPVVRCKNCRHFNMRSMECENDAVSTDHEGGASYSLNFYLDDFCSFGECKMDLEEEK